MASDTEQILDHAKGRQELLGVTRRLEPPHLPFPLARWLMRILGAIVQALVPHVLSVWQQFSTGRDVTRKPVGHYNARRVLQAPQQFPEASHRGFLASSRLNKDIEHSAVLINCAP